jgi:hypothetical protein
LKVISPSKSATQPSSFVVPDIKSQLENMHFSPQHPCALSFIQIVHSLTVNVSWVGVWSPLERYCQVFGMWMCICECVYIRMLFVLKDVVEFGEKLGCVRVYVYL